MPALTLKDKAMAIALRKEDEEKAATFIVEKGQHTPEDKYAGKITIYQKKIVDEQKQLDRL